MKLDHIKDAFNGEKQRRTIVENILNHFSDLPGLWESCFVEGVERLPVRHYQKDDLCCQFEADPASNEIRAPFVVDSAHGFIRIRYNTEETISGCAAFMEFGLHLCTREKLPALCTVLYIIHENGVSRTLHVDFPNHLLEDKQPSPILWRMTALISDFADEIVTTVDLEIEEFLPAQSLLKTD